MSTIANQFNQSQQSQEDSREGTEGLQNPSSGGTVSQNTTQATNAPAAPASPKPKGSGRFTNIQKYLNANSHGSNQVSQGIDNNIQSNLNKQDEKSQGYFSKIREGISNASNSIDQGDQFNNQLGQIGQNIQNNSGADQLQNREANLGINEFVSNPNFSQFQDFQSGRAVDQRLLGVQQNQLVGSANQYLQDSQEALNNVNSENGRFNLLRQTFGGNLNPNYTSGQQRLDGLFLNSQALNPLQQNIKQDVSNAQNLIRNTNSTNSDLNRVASQESSLINQINNQASANEQGYLDRLDSFVPTINENRAAEFQRLEDALSSYRLPVDGENSIQRINPGLTNEQLRQLGVTQERGAFNVLEGLQGASDVAVRGRDAQDFRDVANENDVSRFNDLASIARTNELNKRLTEANSLGAAFTAREDSGNLDSRLVQADSDFNDNLNNTNFNRSQTFVTGGRNVFSDTKFGTTASTISGESLLNSGLDNLGVSYTGESLYDKTSKARNRTVQADHRKTITDQFKQLIDSSGYGKTIGGNLNSDSDEPNVGFGSRSTAGGLEDS